MSKEKMPSPWTPPQDIRNQDAVFIGWQTTRSGEAIALYNVTAEGHPLLGSTVTDKTLQKFNLQVPGSLLPQGHAKKS